MGWTFSNSLDTKQKAVAELLGDGYHKTIAHSLVGNNLWCVKECKEGRYIALFLLDRQGGIWGYKGLDESMGPSEVNCPLAFLSMRTAKMVGYAAGWIAKVKAYHGAIYAPQGDLLEGVM